MMQCQKCKTWMNDEEAFTIQGLGGKHFLKPYCEPCVDAILAVENAQFVDPVGSDGKIETKINEVKK